MGGLYGQGIQVVCDIFKEAENEGFSGGNLERPQFKKMMKSSAQYSIKRKYEIILSDQQVQYPQVLLARENYNEMVI